jgi:hypothetical protein
MAEGNCLIVRAAGRQLDELRSEASRIAKSKRSIGGLIAQPKERAFLLTIAKHAFVWFCTELGVQHNDF